MDTRGNADLPGMENMEARVRSGEGRRGAREKRHERPSRAGDPSETGHGGVEHDHGGQKLTVDVNVNFRGSGFTKL